MRSSPFLKHNLVFFTGSLVVSALNYLYYPVLGRMLEPVHFGEVQALLTLYMQAAIFLSILTYVTVHVTVNSRTETERNQILLSLERVAMLVGYSLLGIALLLTPQLKSFLNFTEIQPFIILIAALALSIPLAFRMAFLRGRKLFAKVSTTEAIGSLSKLTLSSLLVLIGWQTFGAVTGLVLAQIISLWLAIGWAREAGFRGFGLRSDPARLAKLRPHFIYALAVFMVSSGIVAILSIDIIAIKHYFPPEQAGLYAGISTVARIVYFLMAPFTGVLLTLVSLNQTARKNALQLKGSLVLATALGVAALLFMSLFPDFSVRLLVGSKYLTYAQYLPRLALIMLLLSISNTLLMYQISLRRYTYCVWPVLTVLAMISLVYMDHDTVASVINVILTGTFGLVIGICGQMAVRGILPQKSN